MQFQVLPIPCTFLEEVKLSAPALESSPLGGFLGRGCASGLDNGTPLFKRELKEEVEDWIPEPASSIGSQGRNVPFREDLVE